MIGYNTMTHHLVLLSIFITKILLKKKLYLKDKISSMIGYSNIFKIHKLQ